MVYNIVKIVYGGEYIMSNFGEYLRELRGTKSLREMEKITGISHTYLSTLEKGYDPRSGKERKPTPETLKKLSETLEVPYWELMQKAGYIKSVGQHIKKAREIKGLTLEELAKNIGISSNHIDLFENNKKIPSIEILKSISENLEIPLGELLIEAGYIKEYREMLLENLKNPPPPKVPTLGEAIKSARDDIYDEDDNPIDVPLSEIAEKSGISEDVLFRLENGEDIPLTNYQLLNLAKALDVTFGYLFLITNKEKFNLLDSETIDNLIIRLELIRQSDMERITSMSFEEFYELEDPNVLDDKTIKKIYDEYHLSKRIDRLTRLYVFSDIVTDVLNMSDILLSPTFEITLDNRKLSQSDKKKILSKIEEMKDEFEYED